MGVRVSSAILVVVGALALSPALLAQAAAPEGGARAGPIPRAPGILSDGSPRSAMKSATWSGSTP